MTPLDVKEREVWQGVLDRVAERYGVATILTDSKGNVLLSGGAHAPLCAKVRAEPKTLTFVCSQTNTYMLNEARETGQPYSDLCELGLFKTFVPIHEGGELVGGLSACGAALESEPLDEFMVEKTLGVDSAEAERLVSVTPVIGDDEAEGITAMLRDGLRDGVEK